MTEIEPTIRGQYWLLRRLEAADRRAERKDQFRREMSEHYKALPAVEDAPILRKPGPEYSHEMNAALYEEAWKTPKIRSGRAARLMENPYASRGLFLEIMDKLFDA